MLQPSRILGANDRIRVAVIGLRGRGNDHLKQLKGISGVEIAAVCDIDENVTAQRLGDIEKMGLPRPKTFVDIRKVLEDKSIDAVTVATPNHWHSLMGIWACQAGKDAYIEKPISHSWWEGKQLTAAVKKYNRIVQHGTQSRSSAGAREAIEHLRAGLIGDVYLSRGLCFKWRDTIGRKPIEPVPAGVHYDEWLGPAPKREFTRNRFHYNFHWFWDYGNGDIGNQGVHQMDAARWLLGVKYPTKVSAMGGHFMFDDDQETPNTMTASFEFHESGRKKMLVFEVRHWISNPEADIQDIADPMAGPAAGTRTTVGNIVYGSKGYLSTARPGFKIWLGKEQQPGPAPSGPRGGDNWANFIQAVRSRKQSDLNAPIEEGAPSVILIHLANISYRLGRTLYFDPDTLTCKNDAEANAMFTRDYRVPYVVPENV